MSRQIDIRLSPNGEHSAKVADWAARTAALLGYEDQDIRDLFWAARLHDIGKIGIPDPVLSKTGPLNSEEWRLVRMHPTIGASLITALSPLAHLAPIVLSHQERYDGTGYPAGLQGQDIPIGARLLAVVDAYDAMTSDRVYRRALPHDTAVVELEQHAGRQFDPVAVEAFVDMVVPPA
jgi:HD-GYP domain-containing protein (c-di-GMP phosphodiesterase class II)